MAIQRSSTPPGDETAWLRSRRYAYLRCGVRVASQLFSRRRLLGTGMLHLYAQCLQGHPGELALLAIDADRTEPQELKVPVRSERYTLTAAKLMDTAVELNEKTLTVDAEGNVPSLTGVKEKAGKVMLAPESITFLAIPAAENQSCR